MSSVTFTATIVREKKDSGWTFVDWPDSVAFLGTGKATKVILTIDGKEFPVTSLPTGNGPHFLPLNKKLLKAIGKDVGDAISVEVKRPST